MTYEDTIHEKVENHPLIEFQEMGKLTEQDDFGDQLADLVNALSTQIIISVDNENEFKKWAADYADGEIIYAKVDGELTLAEAQNDDPSGPNDIELKGIGAGGSPGRATYIEDSQIHDVAGYEGMATFILRSERSYNTNEVNGIEKLESGSAEEDSAGIQTETREGIRARVSIDISQFDQLRVKFERGYETTDTGEYSGTKYKTRSGKSGDGVGIFDSNDNLLVYASGGGAPGRGIGLGGLESGYGSNTNYSHEVLVNASADGGFAEEHGGNAGTAYHTTIGNGNVDDIQYSSAKNGEIHAPSSHVSIESGTVENDNYDTSKVESFID